LKVAVIVCDPVPTEPGA
jgi:hypothetical protein